jgi:hypothetical protein
MAACIIGRKRWGYTPWSGVEAFKGETSFLSAGLEADRHDVEHSKGSSIHWCSVSLSAQRVLPVTVGRQCSARLAGSPAACTDNRSKKRAKSSMNDYPMRVRQRPVRRTMKTLPAKKPRSETQPINCKNGHLTSASDVENRQFFADLRAAKVKCHGKREASKADDTVGIILSDDNIQTLTETRKILLAPSLKHLR